MRRWVNALEHGFDADSGGDRPLGSARAAGGRPLADRPTALQASLFASSVTTAEDLAAGVGDTVGDPFKDTSGPSMNILIKLMSVVSLVMAPLFM